MTSTHNPYKPFVSIEDIPEPDTPQSLLQPKQLNHTVCTQPFLRARNSKTETLTCFKPRLPKQKKTIAWPQTLAFCHPQSTVQALPM